MSRISDAMLETLMEEITDYEGVALTKEQYEKLETSCDRWRDEESIESEINLCLIGLGYEFNDENCKWELKPKGKYHHTIQIGFDIAIPHGLDSGDVEKFMENEVTEFIEKKTEFLVLNGMFCSEDMSHAYEIDEVNKMYDKPKN